MSEQPEAKEISGKRLYPSPLKRLVITIIGLFIFIVVFGQVVPRLMFVQQEEKVIGNTEKTLEKPEKTLEKPEKKIEEKPIEEQAQTPTEEKLPKETPPKENLIINSVPPISPTEPSTQKEPLPQDAEHLYAIEEKVASLEAAHETAIAELKSKLDTQNSSTKNKIDSMLSSLVVFGQLKDAMNNGDSYDMELNQLKKFTENNSQIGNIITALETNSSSGITTLAQLKTKFTPLIKQALINKNENHMLRILHKFITIRKVGEQVGSDDESVLSRAEIKLSQDDLSSTLNELEQLSPQAKEVFDNWSIDAQNLLDSHANLYKLQLMLTQIEPASQP